ncbi:MAG: hypothetical protein AMXMBFR55_17190 [Gemmatimonadota bacterium]
MAPPSPAVAGSELDVYVMTMGQGDLLWERFGHNAIGIRDRSTGTDLVYNWGMFSFDQPGFLPRFLRGEMLYWMAPFDAVQTLVAYQMANRSVTIQWLNLSPAQKDSLRRVVEWNARDENKFYRYDYYRDNCSTRVRDALDLVLGGAIRRATEPQPTAMTYRDHSLRLMDGMFWTRTGIDLGLGAPTDRPITAWEAMFIPMEVQRRLRDVRIPDASGAMVPLVASEDVLFQATRTPERMDVPRPARGALVAGVLAAAAMLALGYRTRGLLRPPPPPPVDRDPARRHPRQPEPLLHPAALAGCGGADPPCPVGKARARPVAPPRAPLGRPRRHRRHPRPHAARTAVRGNRRLRRPGVPRRVPAGAARGVPRAAGGSCGGGALGRATEPRMRHSIGIDVGGTFTDLVAVSLDDGTARSGKVLSTPHDQSQGVEEALQAQGPPAPRVARIVHGTTVVTNMLLERRGARVALCATRGATDLLELRRQERASLYDLAACHPPPLVDAAHVVAVHERLVPGGVEDPLTPAEAANVAEQVAALDPEIVAIALLHAYADPVHELRLAEAIAARLPAVDIVCSSDVLPEIREFERTATTTCEAYARPGVRRYLENLTTRVAALGMPAPGVVSSSGGMRDARDAARHAASLALSGPAGGVAGAALVTRLAGFDRALSIDIGGTSADVGLILEGEPLVEAGGAVAGIPIALPRVLVETVSAGGGSLGWVDDGGALRVGPRSAGAVPGPVAFGRGGTQATVTDAHVTLGNIRADRMARDVHLDAEGARAAVSRLAAALGATPERTAQAMIDTADAEMARALRRVSVERGVDPRGCVLVAFGGGGPLHACALADRLGMTRILVPPHAGVLSALGLAVAPERRVGLASVLRPLLDLPGDALARLAEEGAARAGGEGTPRFIARIRYRGQGHELEVPFTLDDPPAAVDARFAAMHARRYGFTLDLPAHVVSLRCTRSSTAPALVLRRQGANRWGDGGFVDSGGALSAVVRGPAVIALPDATLLVAPGWTARALDMGGWILESAG